MLNTLLKRFPTKKWLDEVSAKPPHTPDVQRLERSPYCLFFEYGDLQNRMPKHQMVRPYHSQVAFTVQKFYHYTQTVQEEVYPVAFEDRFENRLTHRAKIRGELYAVRMPSPILIDSYRQNGIQFDRKRVKVLTKSTDRNGNFVPVFAWMYVGKAEYWREMFDWDTSFHKEREGSRFKPVNAFKDNAAEFNNYTYFRLEDTKNLRDNRCFIHLKNGQIFEPTDTK